METREFPMTDRSTEQMASLASGVRSVTPRLGLQSTLHTLLESACTLFPEIDHAGISIAHRDGGIETVAITDDLVRQLDQLQYDLGEGPCLYAVTEDPVVIVEDVRDDQRWPRFVPAAVALGLRSQIGLRLYSNDETMGGLNLYSTSSDTIAPHTEPMAELFAAIAATVMGHARHEHDLAAALASRQVIGQATGIVMERYSMDEHRAFSYLLRVSSLSNVKVRDLAREMVDTARSSGSTAALTPPPTTTQKVPE
jgi:GAF domain-containing protein